MLRVLPIFALPCVIAAVLSFIVQALASAKDQAHPLSRRQSSQTLQQQSDPNVTAIIDFMLSNWWNNTQYLATSTPGIAFLKNVTYNGSSTNATATTPLIVGIEVQERRQYQRMTGLGASITDAAAIVLQSLRVDHPDSYEEILNLAFNESPDWINRGGAAMNMIRTPIGSSDFGFTQYSYDDTEDGTPDPDLQLFDIEKSPKRWQTFQDILAINPNIKIIGSAWSPPAWMKSTQTSYDGGEILQKYEGVYCDYLVKFIQTVAASKGIHIQYITLINNPLQVLADRPSTSMTAEQQARIGVTCRSKLNAADLNNVKILAYDYNWDHPEYPIEVYDRAKESFDGVAWKCYSGDPSQQDTFNNVYPEQEVMLTECTRITQYEDETWSNLQRQFNELITGSVDYGSRAIVLWNLALQVDPEGFTIPTIPNQCQNCLAPFLIFDNSTQPNLEGANMTQIQQSREKSAEKRDFKEQFEKMREQMTRTEHKDPMQNVKNVPIDQVNKGADNSGQVIPPYRDTYYQTSDFVAMVHLGRAIRPNDKGGRWAQRVGVRTTDDDMDGPRIKAQLFRNGLDNGRSRWSLLLLQWYTHYDYYYAAHEDMTIQIKFRDSVATMVIPPGVYTISWEADDSKYEHDE